MQMNLLTDWYEHTKVSCSPFQITPLADRKIIDYIFHHLSERFGLAYFNVTVGQDVQEENIPTIRMGGRSPLYISGPWPITRLKTSGALDLRNGYLMRLFPRTDTSMVLSVVWSSSRICIHPYGRFICSPSIRIQKSVS